jgi:hypothetical protein
MSDFPAFLISLVTIGCLAPALLLYTYLALKHHVTTFSTAVFMGISGAVTRGRLPIALIHHEVSITFLMLAQFAHFVLKEHLLHHIFELLFAASYLSLGILVLITLVSAGRIKRSQFPITRPAQQMQ